MTEQIDKRAAAQVLDKLKSGASLTSTEKRTLKRYEKEREERLRWEYYKSIPQKHWREMSGRQTKVINEQAERYGIPFGGRTIDLPSVVRGLHNFLAENAAKLAADDDPLMRGEGSPALERYREERAAIARLDRLERERMLIPRDDVRTSLGRIAALIREAGETLQRQFGAEAAEILLEAMDDAEQEIERTFGESADPAATS